MPRSARFALVGALIAATVAFTFTVSVAPPAEAAGHGAAQARAGFHDEMRRLWEDHIVWTRQYIVSAATTDGDLPDIGPTTDRLLANQVDIGNALGSFYGPAAGEAVTALLTDHILIAANLVAAAKAGDEAEIGVVAAAWYANGHDIAAALNGLNPRFWPLDHLETMMRAHLDRTLEEAVARIEGRYEDDIAAYEQIHADILEMADMLSDGIIRQFPGAFH